MSSAQDLIAAALADIDSRPATPAIEIPSPPKFTPQPWGSIPKPQRVIIDTLPPFETTYERTQTTPAEYTIQQQRDAAILERDAAVQAAEAAYARIVELERVNQSLWASLQIARSTIEFMLNNCGENANLLGHTLAQLREITG